MGVVEEGGWRGHLNLIALFAFIALILAIGLNEIFLPFGLDLGDLTAGNLTLDTMVRIGILTIVVVGLNLLMGYAGQISLGQAGFFGLGAYASAILTTLAARHNILPGVSDSWWWAWLVMIGGMVVVGGLAYLLGKVIFRLRGHYLAMATLGLGIVISILFRENLGFKGGHITGAFDGIPDISRLAIGDLFLVWPKERYYFFVWGAAIGAIIIALNIVNSRVGRALRAIHSSEIAADTMGVDIERYKIQALVVSAIFASLAGSLYAHFQGAVTPATCNFSLSIELVVMAAVGGLASIWGAPFGVAFVYVVKEVLRARMQGILHGAGGEHELLAYGILLAIIMIFMPEGLTAGGLKALRRLRQTRVQQSGEQEKAAAD